MKVLAMYLPQYHTFPENDEWWGKGYTEWTAVKRGKPLYSGHVQPRIPLNNNYYDLVNDGINTWKWQASLAEEYGVYGYCIYQYWFSKEHRLMDRPMEILYENPDIDVNYCICWANESFTRTWYGLENKILMEQIYGQEDEWRAHFEYNLKFFKDSRYIKIDNKPLFMIYKSQDIPCIYEMLEKFNQWAKEEGFSGIYVVSGITAGGRETRKNVADGCYYFEPGYTLKNDFSAIDRNIYNIKVFSNTILNKIRKNKKLERYIPVKKIYEGIANREYQKNDIPCIFPDWDNTPRRSYKGLVYKGTSPELFEKYLNKLKEKNTEYVIVNAWNEWGEGAYLEPDERNNYKYLEAIKRVFK